MTFARRIQEIEPFLAVDPTAPGHMIGVFQQDRWDNGGAHGIVAAVTNDGGATWAETWAHFGLCSGGGDFWAFFSASALALAFSASICAVERHSPPANQAFLSCIAPPTVNSPCETPDFRASYTVSG